ncbi:hypothetical protein SKAU_G00332550 [Synaphobranchus kaupii]|uniref:Protein phosphatase 1 regulatory subunit 16B n=1 Tax=Synaphobranchus kaupii TaxID=118154 RepID=A0A9Q1IIQ7_SYNKA|nr:hypothetical protein SKAU_G00332550 [Synaphobranchus kaupii]
MASHRDLVKELEVMEKTPSMERLRLAQKRRAQQLKRWATREKETLSKKRKADKRRGPAHRPGKHVCFPATVALLEAVSRNDLEEVRYLLENSVSPDLCNEDGLTALHQCCIDDHEHMVEILLNGGASVNVRDNELWTPLHAAATCGHTGLIHTLIQRGADLLAVNSDGNMPYDLCEDDSVLDIIEASMDQQGKQGITQAMINERRASLERRMLGDIQVLLRDGEDTNQQDSQGGVTLLHIAAAHGLLQVAELLLQGGGSTDLRDRDGWQPLHAAACWGQVHVAELLVSHGASLNARTWLDETPIDLCDDEQCRALLLDLKHKHDVIMRSQLRHTTPLCRRSSSTGSRGKLVRKTSLSDRNSLYRREYQTMAALWMGSPGGEEEGEDEEEEGEGESDQRDSQSVNDQEGGTHNGLVPMVTAFPAHPPCVGDLQAPVIQNVPCPPLPEGVWSNGRGLTLFELKKQRAAAKVLGHAQPNGHLGDGSGGPGSEDSLAPLLAANGSAVFYTPASGDPPLLRLKQPMEELEVKVLKPERSPPKAHASSSSARRADRADLRTPLDTSRFARPIPAYFEAHCRRTAVLY